MPWLELFYSFLTYLVKFAQTVAGFLNDTKIKAVYFPL